MVFITYLDDRIWLYKKGQWEDRCLPFEVALLELATIRDLGGRGRIWTLLNGHGSTLEEESRLWKHWIEEIMALRSLEETSTVFKLFGCHQINSFSLPTLPSYLILSYAFNAFFIQFCVHEPESLLVGKECCSLLETKIGSIMKIPSSEGIWNKKIILIIKA